MSTEIDKEKLSVLMKNAVGANAEGNLVKAIENYVEILEICTLIPQSERTKETDYYKKHSHMAMGQYYMNVGDYKTAYNHFLSALDIYNLYSYDKISRSEEKTIYYHDLCVLNNNIGYILLLSQKYSEAELKCTPCQGQF